MYNPLMAFKDRNEAGEKLSEALAKFKDRQDTIVVALPRGGVAVGHTVAKKLRLPLEALVVRKLGVPGNPELAFGAIAEGGGSYVDKLSVKAMDIIADEIENTAKKEFVEITRRIKKYRGTAKKADYSGKTIILVDDGIATGATMRAAIRSLRMQSPHEIITAVPVASNETAEEIRILSDEIICLETRDYFRSVGSFYKNFSQLSDEEVVEMLRRTD